MAFTRDDWRFPTPYGVASWLNMVITFFAVLFFMLSAFRCYFTVSETEDYKVFIGYWSAESIDTAQAAGKDKDNNYCVSWDKGTRQDLFDGPWKFGRALGIMGSLICLPFFLLSLYILFYEVQTRLFSLTICVNLSMAVISLLLLIGLSSDVCGATACEMGPGGYLAILDFFLWIVAAFFAFRLRGLSLEQEYADDGAPPSQEPNEKPFPALPPSTTPQDTLSLKV